MIASDIMTRDVITIPQSATLVTAIALMGEQRVSGLPVVDAGGQLVGVLTEGDLLRRVETGTGPRHRSRLLEYLLGPGHEASDYVKTHSRRVSDLMTEDVVTVSPSTPLEEVVDLMERHLIRRVPVVRDGQPVGMISRADLVRALGRRLAAIAGGGVDGTEVEAVLKAELAANPGLAANNISVFVRNGVVTMDGVIYDNRTRDALRVAAQNITGISAVNDRLVWVDPVLGMVMP